MKTLILASVLASAITGPAFADTTLKLVEVITSPQRTETLKSIVGTFEKQNPGTHVDIISLPWGEAFQKFATMVAAGNIPDVVEMPDTWLSLYANNHMLESLEPYLKDWKYTSDLSDRTLELGRTVDKTAYMLPYGFYLNALFYNKKLLAQAGISAPPKTMDEFLADSKKISAIPGKYGYCLRGGSGGFNSWAEFGTNMAGSDAFFTKDGKSTMNDAGWVKGLTWLIDLYKDGYAPKDAVNWGFNETVAGFYSGTCAFLNQDPDALIGISSRMSPDDFGVTNFPAGPSGKAFPTIGYAGWSMMAKSAHKEEAWKLIATLEGPEGNVPWNKRTGALPALKSAEKDPFYQSAQFKGWFAELADPNVVPMTMPTYLEGFAFFKDSLVVSSGQKALLGEITPQQLADQWADYMTKDQAKFLAKGK